VRIFLNSLGEAVRLIFANHVEVGPLYLLPCGGVWDPQNFVMAFFNPQFAKPFVVVRIRGFSLIHIDNYRNLIINGGDVELHFFSGNRGIPGNNGIKDLPAAKKAVFQGCRSQGVGTNIGEHQIFVVDAPLDKPRLDSRTLGHR
jgi:hypothetical protein